MKSEQIRNELIEELDLLSALCAPDPDAVGLESISVDVFVSTLHKAVSKSSDLYHTIVEENQTVEVVQILPSNFTLTPSAKGVNFIAQGKNLAFMPAGFSGKVNEFATFLVSISDEMNDCLEALARANKVLGMYVTHPDEMKKVSSAEIPVLKKVKKFVKEFADYFKGKEGMDRDLVKRLYRSYKDFDESTELLFKLTQKFNGKSVESTSKEYHRLLETVGHLINAADKTDGYMTKDVARNIAQGLYNLADWLSLYSLFIAKLVSATNAHRDTAKHLNAIAD